MTIQTFSPLKGSGNYYLNAEEFESKLMFNDTNTSLNYAIVRYDYNDSVWKIIATGKLNGYNNNTNYNYRIDLDNYIKIEQYRTLDLAKYHSYPTNTQWLEEVLYQDIPKYMSKVSVLLSTGNIITDNSSKITLQSNGEYWLNGSYIPSDLTATYKYDYKFYDKSTSELNPITISDFVYGGTWLPITTYSNTSWTYILIKDKYRNTLVEEYLHSINDGVPTLFMIYIPIKATTVKMYSLEMQNNNLPTKIYNVVNRCINPYYFWNVNGSLDVIYSEGNVHEVNTITKDYITIGNQKFPMNIKNTKQYKSNTGFKLNQNQMYSLLKTPFIFKLYDGYLSTLNRNYILNSDHISTITTPVTLTIDPTIYLLNDSNYIFSIESAIVNIGTPSTYTVEVVDTGTSTISYSKVFTFNTTKQYFNIGVPTTGNYSILLYPGIKGSTTGNSVTFNNVKLEFENDEYLIYENLIGILFSLEKDGIPTAWTAALEDTNSQTPKTKRLLLDTSTFEGYVGSRYSERNVELILTDEKTYKRKTNFNLTFWD